MKKEYSDKLTALRDKEVRTPEEEALLAALVDLEAKEKAQPFDRPAVEAAREVVADTVEAQELP